MSFYEDTRNQERTQPPGNDTFINLQSLLSDEDQTINQGGQKPPHGQPQQNTANIGVAPPEAPIVNQDSDFDHLDYYDSEMEFSDPKEVLHDGHQTL